MKKALQASDSLQVSKAVIVAADSLIATLNSGIANKQTLLEKSESSNEASRRVIRNLDQQILEKDRANKLAIDQVGLLHRQLKKQKWLTVKVLGLSLSTIGTLTYLLLK